MSRRGASMAMRVQAAVFTAYALRLDRLSLTHLSRTAWYLARNRMGIGGEGYLASPQVPTRSARGSRSARVGRPAAP